MAQNMTDEEYNGLKHKVCVYRALAAMATNYADTMQEIYYGLTDVQISDMTLPTVEAAEVWSHKFNICDCES